MNPAVPTAASSPAAMRSLSLRRPPLRGLRLCARVARRFVPLLFILPLLLIVPMLAVAGPVDDGIAAFGRGELARSYQLLSGPAQSGDARAQYYMGALAQAGRGSNSARWFEQAAAQGLADAMVALGVVYLQGRERPRDEQQALRLFRQGAEAGSSQGLFYLSRHYEAGLLVPRDPARAAELRKRAAAAGNADALALLERSRTSDTAIVTDTAHWLRLFGRNDEAFAARLRAARAGDAFAQAQVAIHYREGFGVNRDLAEALRWNREAARQSQPEALYSLGLHYMNGWGVRADRAEALAWFRKAQDAGHPMAKNAVASLSAPVARSGSGGGGFSEYDTYMQIRRDACFLSGTSADQYGTCR